MAILIQLTSLTIPLILSLSIPLLGFAFFTTLISLSVLLLRVLIVYFELFLAVIPHYLSPFPKTCPLDTPKRHDIKYATKIRTTGPVARRRRRSSSSLNSVISSTSITPTLSTSSIVPKSTSGVIPHLKASASTSAIIHPLALSTHSRPQQAYTGTSSERGSRDYEGVGGWRLGGDDDYEAAWTNINSRLELPAEHSRRHKRSLTGGSIKTVDLSMGKIRDRDAESVRSISPEAGRECNSRVRRSWDKEAERACNVGRVRTPLEEKGGDGEYFANASMSSSMLVSPKQTRRAQSTHTMTSSSSASS